MHNTRDVTSELFRLPDLLLPETEYLVPRFARMLSVARGNFPSTDIYTCTTYKLGTPSIYARIVYVHKNTIWNIVLYIQRNTHVVCAIRMYIRSPLPQSQVIVAKGVY
jgi:hypothetical protein